MKLHRLIMVAAIAILAWLGIAQVRSALPPRSIVIETGPVGGSYHRNAERYAEIMRDHGFDLQLRPNPDSLTIVDHVSRRQDGAVIGFSAQEIDPALVPDAVSVAVVEFQPLFLFYDTALGRMGSPVNLRSRHIVLPFENSATSRAALDVMALYGVTRENSRIDFMPISEAAEALQQGRADAGFFMLASEHAMIRAMAEDRELALYSFQEAQSISINLKYLGPAHIPVGAFSLEGILPPVPLDLIGAPINVVAHRDLHPAVIYALIEALQQVHGERTAVSEAGQYPAFTGTALPLHEGSQTFQAGGRPWSHRVFSPTLASLIDEFFIFALAVFLVTEVYRTVKYANELLEVSLDSMLFRILAKVELRGQGGRPLRWPDRILISIGRRVSQRIKAQQKLKDTMARIDSLQLEATRER